jgi:hypothetical protein
MKMMALGMFVFLFAIGAATFLESAYDTQTARIIIYNALWFEILLTYRYELDFKYFEIQFIP